MKFSLKTKWGYVQLIYLLFIISFIPQAKSQPLRYLGIEQGLSNNTVTSIHKDSFGFMWFGTLDGLNRYDGYNFLKFRNRYRDTTSLPYDIITCITSDKRGNLWVGTQKGLGLLNNKSFLFSPLKYKNPDNGTAILESVVNDVKLDHNGRAFIATADMGLLRCNANQHVAQRIPLKLRGHNALINYTVTAMCFKGDDEVWMTIENVGLCAYQKQTGTWKLLTTGFQSATSVEKDNSGNLWIGTVSGLYGYNAALKTISRYNYKDQLLNNCKVFDLQFDNAGTLWIATDGKGIVQLNTKNAQEHSVREGEGAGLLTSDAIYSIYEDEMSRKWIGTLRGGINILGDKKNQFITYQHQQGNKNSLVNNFTFSFCEDNSKIWIGTDGGGVSLWDRKAQHFVNYNLSSENNKVLSDNRVSSIIKDNLGGIWLGTYGGTGVRKFDRKENRFKPVKFNSSSLFNSVWKLLIDGEQRIWASCLRGNRNDHVRNRLFVYDTGKMHFEPAPFEVKGDILSIIDAEDGSLWLGGFSALMHASKKAGVDKTIELGAAVRALHKSKAGTIWIGTYGRGLMLFNPESNKFKIFDETNGLCNNKVLNIEEDKNGFIWVSTYFGISKVDPRSHKIQSFYAADGLQSNQFYYNASTVLSTGEIMFGGIKGFNLFNPDSIRQTKVFPPLVTTSIRIANTEVNSTNEYFRGASNIYGISDICLPYEKAIFSLEYVALEYSLPEKIQYAYMLSGRDKSWVNVNNQRTINYSHLNEGDYTLKIRSTNSSGIWNPVVRQIHITILPPWYRTWWAYLMYVILLAGSVFGYLLYHREQTRLAYEVKLIKEVNEKKIAFFTNISHELRTPLTLIVNPLKDLLQSDGPRLELIDISSVYRNSRRLLSLVDQLLLFRTSENEVSDLKPAVIDLKEVCYEVFLCFNNQVKSKSMVYNFLCTEEVIMVYADREKLEIVLFNLLSNAIKYTPWGGTVELTLTESHNQIGFYVKDSGPGIPADAGQKLFDKFYRLPQGAETVAQSGFGIGLFLAKKFVDLHQGHISYSCDAAGTTFRVTLPKHDKESLLKSESKVSVKSNTLPLLQEIVSDGAAQKQAKLPVKEDQQSEVLEGIIQAKPVVLLIDDDDEVRGYIRSLLENQYVVHEAENAEVGFHLVLEHQPDIIVCDVIMHGMTGVEFCTTMKEAPSLSHIPIILLTGTSSPEIKLKGIECGADDYISKPFESDLLVARIKSLIKGRDLLKDYFFNEITLKNNGLKVPAEYSDFLYKCIEVIERFLDDEGFTVIALAEEIGMSRSKLYRKIKSISGLSNTEFIRYIRLRKAAELMIQTDLQIKEISYKVGFQDIKYFREQFFKLFKMNPSDFIRKYRNAYAKGQKLNASLTSHKGK